MTDRMARQFSAVTRKRPVVIGNFIDEAELEPFRSLSETESPGWRFVFVGRLCPLKSPGQAIDAVCLMAERGISCSLDLYGGGPLLKRLRSEVMKRGCTEIIRFHGHINNPWTVAASAHCLVLPSLTEGISRAVLEALYLGVPCVLRDVDSNSELIQSGYNGELFSDAVSLISAMKNVAQLGSRLASPRPIFLSEQFRQALCVRSYYQLLQQI